MIANHFLNYLWRWKKKRSEREKNGGHVPHNTHRGVDNSSFAGHVVRQRNKPEDGLIQYYSGDEYRRNQCAGLKMMRVTNKISYRVG